MRELDDFIQSSIQTWPEVKLSCTRQSRDASHPEPAMNVGNKCARGFRAKRVQSSLAGIIREWTAVNARVRCRNKSRRTTLKRLGLRVFFLVHKLTGRPAALRPVLFALVAVFSCERFRTAPLRALSPTGLVDGHVDLRPSSRTPWQHEAKAFSRHSPFFGTNYCCGRRITIATGTSSACASQNSFYSRNYLPIHFVSKVGDSRDLWQLL